MKLGTRSSELTTSWSDRSVVEVIGPNKAAGWFMHALTGDEWLLTLKFRVKRQQFQATDLQQRLCLKPLDDIRELPVYGRGDRVRVKNLKGPWQEVTITVHWLREIDTPEFWDFLKAARESYLAKTDVNRLNLDDLTPWKQLGQKWHLSRKGFPSNKRVVWQPELIGQLADALDATCPRADTD